MKFESAEDIQKRIRFIVEKTGLEYINPRKIKCYRSFETSTRARARIWAFPKIWQDALKVEPHYIIEVISEKFDRLNQSEKDRTLIHELLHIPKNFSGALLPHRSKGRAINSRAIDYLYAKLER